MGWAAEGGSAEGAAHKVTDGRWEARMEVPGCCRSQQLCPGEPLMAELKLAQGVAQRPLPSFWVPSSPALRSPWLQRGPLAGTCHGDVLTEPSTWEPGKGTPGIQSWSRHPQGPHGSLKHSSHLCLMSWPQKLCCGRGICLVLVTCTLYFHSTLIN